MRTPQGFFTIYQPKYRTPSAFDLNERGIFKLRPCLTADWGFRVIADDARNVQLQFVHLVDFSQIDPKTGEAYVCKTVTINDDRSGPLTSLIWDLKEQVTGHSHMHMKTTSELFETLAEAGFQRERVIEMEDWSKMDTRLIIARKVA